MEKILYVSDLDGTLMHHDQTISQFTVKTINELIEQGMIFSFATARSLVTAAKITERITATLPAVVYNGTFIIEKQTGELLHANYFLKEEQEQITATLLEAGIYPIVYAYVDGVEKFSYYRERCNQPTKEFIDTKKGDIRDNPVTSVEELLHGEIFYFTCIGTKEELKPMCEKFKKDYYCLYQTDIYSGAQWLEIIPNKATKANAVLQLKELLGCDKIVVFGDAKNDIPMFRISDECYAVENAVPELKEIATGVIGSNEEDGVAKWLSENWTGDKK